MDNGFIIMARVFFKNLPEKDGRNNCRIEKMWLDPHLFTEKDPDSYFNGDEEGWDDDFGD